MTKSPYESKYADTPGYRTHYIEEGDGGEVVILIHAGGPGGDSYGNWFGCLKSFGKTYRTIACDMVGYGNIMPDCSHRAMRQHPELFSKIALDFMGGY